MSDATEPPAGPRLLPFKGKAKEVQDEGTTCVQLLRELIERIESGEIVPDMLVVHYLKQAPQADLLQHGYWRWHCRPIEHLGLLQMGAADVIRGD